MGKFDNRDKVPGGESYENHSNVSFSGKEPSKNKKLAVSVPYFSDPLLIPRINQYLAENKDKLYIDINDMVSGLQSRYREYARRKRNIFRQAVQKAFNTILQQCALTSNLPDQGDKFGDEYVSTDQSSSDVEECNSGENEEKFNSSSNSQLMNLYKPARVQNVSDNFQKNPGQNAELIDLSSDDENIKKKDGEDENVFNDTTKNGVEKHSHVKETPITYQRKASNKIASGKQEKVGMPRKRKLSSLLDKIGSKQQKRASFQESKVTFADFGGNAKALEEVCKLILHIRHPEFYRQIGLTSPRGFLLHGPPGCGKTLLAAAIAGELEVRFLKVSAPELVGGVSGESEERIRELFDNAVESAPCVLFIDEVDAITPNRQNAQREMERRIVAQLLTCLDELSNAANGDQVLVIGATNRPDSLDPALRRAGRFDKEVCLGIPDLKAREQILKVVCKNLKMAPNFPYGEIATNTPGFVGADLLALAREAAMAAVNRVFEAIQHRGKEKGVKRKKIKLDDSKGSREGKDDSMNTSNEEVNDLSKSGVNTYEGEDVNVTENDTDVISKDESMDKGDESRSDKVVDAGSNDKGNEEEISGQSNKTQGKEKSSEKEDSDMDIEETASEDSVNCEVRDIEICKDGSVKTLDTEDESELEVLPESYQSEPPSVETLLSWLRNMPPLTANQLENVYLTQDDFRWALRCVQPSAKREGFATVPDVTWDDIGSLADIREELKMSILGGNADVVMIVERIFDTAEEFLFRNGYLAGSHERKGPVKMRKQFEQLGLTAPSGILICGPPGCGKTLLAKAVANEAGINFISVKGPELLNMYVGESERAVRQCFQRARNSAPCVIFFDELDALCPKRSNSGENGASMRVVNQMLTEMDGVEDRKEVYLMAATNRPDIVDPAVLRPGRLDKVLYVGLPEADDRIDILRALTKNGRRPKLAENVNLEEIARRPECNGYSGADLAALVREAGVQALKDMIARSQLEAECDVAISPEHFERALKIIRPSVSDKDRKHYESLKVKYCSST